MRLTHFNVMLDKTNPANKAVAAKIRTNYVVIEKDNELIIKAPRQIAGLVNPFQVEQFLEFLSLCDRPTLLSELLVSMLADHIRSNFGHWEYNLTELEMYETLQLFISKLGRQAYDEDVNE